MHITEAMKRLGQGKVAEEFEDSLRTACAKAVELDGKSELSLKLVIAPNGEGVEIQSTVGFVLDQQDRWEREAFLGTAKQVADACSCTVLLAP